MSLKAKYRITILFSSLYNQTKIPPSFLLSPIKLNTLNSTSLPNYNSLSK